jgi:hypothetical protein
MNEAYFRTKFYMPKFGGSLVIVIRAKPNEQFGTASVLFYILE